MPHDLGRNAPLTDLQHGDLLDELELRCRTDVSSARGMASYRLKVAVTVRPANVVDRESVVAAGHTIELRRQGAVCLASHPAMVGSLFQLKFDREDLDLAPTFAMCDRCSMLSDSSFELCFRFVQEIDLPSPTAGERDD